MERFANTGRSPSFLSESVSSGTQRQFYSPGLAPFAPAIPPRLTGPPCHCRDRSLSLIHSCGRSDSRVSTASIMNRRADRNSRAVTTPHDHWPGLYLHLEYRVGFPGKLIRKSRVAWRPPERVLYIENMGVRTPSLGDAGRVAGRLKNWAAARKSKGVREVAENIHVCSPLVCPPFGSRWRRTLNQRIFLPRLKRAARDLGFRDPLIWTYLPTDTSVDLIRALSSPIGMVIYHCVADFTQLTNAAELLRESENACCR